MAASGGHWYKATGTSIYNPAGKMVFVPAVKSGTIKVAQNSAAGGGFTSATGKIQGALAVTKSLGVKGYVVTHTETGAAVTSSGKPFKTEAEAILAMQALNQMGVNYKTTSVNQIASQISGQDIYGVMDKYGGIGNKTAKAQIAEQGITINGKKAKKPPVVEPGEKTVKSKDAVKSTETEGASLTPDPFYKSLEGAASVPASGLLGPNATTKTLDFQGVEINGVVITHSGQDGKYYLYDKKTGVQLENFNDFTKANKFASAMSQTYKDIKNQEAQAKFAQETKASAPTKTAPDHKTGNPIYDNSPKQAMEITNVYGKKETVQAVDTGNGYAITHQEGTYGGFMVINTKTGKVEAIHQDFDKTVKDVIKKGGPMQEKVAATSEATSTAKITTNGDKAFEKEKGKVVVGEKEVVGVEALNNTVITKNPDTGKYDLYQADTGKLLSTHDDYILASMESTNPNNLSKAATEGVIKAPETAPAQTLGKEPATGGALNFDAQKGDVEITTLLGKKETVQGVKLNESYAITQNPNTQKYHLVDLETGSTVSIHGSADEAKTAADIEAKNNTNTPPPKLPASYKVWNSTHEADVANQTEIAPYYTKHAAENGYNTPAHSAAVSYYQSSSGCEAMNSHLWKGSNASPTTQKHIKNLDDAFKKTATPHDMVTVRSKGAYDNLFQMAKHMDVGDTYKPSGYDSSSLQSNNNWGGGNVRIVYRIPKGYHALSINGVHGNYHAYGSENEILIPRGSQWKVIGKQTKGGKITITVTPLGDGTEGL